MPTSIRSFAILLALSMQAASCIAEAPAQDIDVFCSAISLDDDDRNKSVPEPPGKVVVIAVGTVRKVPGSAADDAELIVERTLFGPPLKSIPVTGVEPSVPPQPMIYCLSCDYRAPDFRLTVSRFFRRERILPLNEEPAIKALARARLDLLVLGSPVIFVGHPVVAPATAAPADKPPAAGKAGRDVAVTVDRTLYGSGPTKGARVRVSGGEAAPAADAYIYFAAPVDGDGNETPGNPAQYQARYRWPASEVKQVEETLQRRALFPIRESIDFYGRKMRLQEITFRGTTAEARSLLSSSLDSVRTLGARRLVYDGGAPPAGFESDRRVRKPD